ncbi:hypothetical protein Fot_07240 [Forsythia ovata]|uniref:Uncharacterized protein n=1 Tax=Forsythia ovata TaxID=205694 RepID=A0ABD1WV91_9LAMI
MGKKKRAGPIPMVPQSDRNGDGARSNVDSFEVNNTPNELYEDTTFTTIVGMGIRLDSGYGGEIVVTGSMMVLMVVQCTYPLPALPSPPDSHQVAATIAALIKSVSSEEAVVEPL